MNLNPRVSSNFCAAFIKPRLPSFIKSGKLKPWFWYCFATLTTKRRFARVNLSNARWSPLRMRCANSTSSSTVIKSSLPISCRYLSSEALSRLVIDLVIFNCRMLLSNVFLIKPFCAHYLQNSLQRYEFYRIFLPSSVIFEKEKSGTFCAALSYSVFVFFIRCLP